MNEKLSNQINRATDSELRSILKEISRQIPDVDQTIENFYKDRSKLKVPSRYQMEKELKQLGALLDTSEDDGKIDFPDYFKKMNLIYFKVQTWIDIFFKKKMYRELLQLNEIILKLEDEWEEKDLPLLLDLPQISDISDQIGYRLGRHARVVNSEERIKLFNWFLRNLSQNHHSAPSPYSNMAELFLNYLHYSYTEDDELYGQDLFETYESFFFNPNNQLIVRNPKYRDFIVDYILLAHELRKSQEYLDKLYNHFSFIQNLKDWVKIVMADDIEKGINSIPSDAEDLLNLRGDEEFLDDFLQYLDNKYNNEEDFNIPYDGEIILNDSSISSNIKNNRKRTKPKNAKKNQKKNRKKQRKKKK